MPKSRTLFPATLTLRVPSSSRSASTPAAWRRTALALFAIFALVNTANALNKGGDATVFFEGGRRLLAVAPLYEGSSAADGFIGPPFQALFFAPFAAIAGASEPAARVVWHALNIAALVIGVWCAWRVAQIALKLQSPFPLLFAPLAAVLLPLQTNFEHQNMNALLLALVAGATWQLTTGAAAAAGLLIGAATALKAFPAILIVWLLARRLWTTALAAIVTTIALTMMPIAIYGPARFAEQLETFARLGNSGWPVRGNNQSLIAALDRLTNGLGGEGVRVASEAPIASSIFIACAVALAAAIAVLIVRTRISPATIGIEAAAVTTLGVLLSPIAWDHYWTLLFPAFLFVYAGTSRALLGRGGQWAFWTAAVLTTGFSPLTLGGRGFNAAREMSVDTVAALVLFAALLALWWKVAFRRSDSKG